MEYRTLGKTDLKLPVISLGTWAIGGWLWGGTDDDLAVRAIQAAIDNGITCVDTAAMYGMGHSERVVGRAIADRRDKVIVATKCGLRWNLDDGVRHFDTKMPDGTPTTVYRNLRPESIRYECEQSLMRLGVDVIDLYQCHWPDPSSNLNETMDTLLALQAEGKIRAIGVSNFTTEMMAQCLGKGVIASDQPLYNPLERQIEAEVLPFCIENEIGVLAYSPIAQGLMTGKVTMDRVFKGDDIRQHRPWYKPENRARVLEVLEQITPIAEAHDATLGQVAINWVISQKGVTSALVGARNEAQVLENAGAVAFQLTGEELTRIRTLVEGLGAPL
jgi:aryl-alcohol dehydrogenase-like predicted oxidoreductase